MKAKSIFLLIILFTSTAALFCEELEFVTIRRTMLYYPVWSSLDVSRDAAFEVEEGTRVSYVERPSLALRTTVSDERIISGGFVYNNTPYIINSADLIPANTVDTFYPSFISDLNSSDRKVWVPSWYAKVLQSMDRNTILSIAPYWEHEYDPWWMITGRQEWYESFYGRFPINEFLISNSALIINQFIRILIRNIRKVENGYAVTVSFAWENWVYHKNSLNWDRVDGKEFFDMILIVDGDYMDVYLEDTEHKLETFMLADRVFLNEMRSLVRDNTADLSRITSWPRRANGTMDYPPPVDMSGFHATHTTTDRLRVRDNPTTASLIVTTLDVGTEVQVLETGRTETIGNITAPWVRVLSANGFTGWAFSGFLESTAPVVEPAASENIITIFPSNFADQESPIAQSPAGTSPLPLWVLFVMGGAVALGGGAVFLVKRKK